MQSEIILSDCRFRPMQVADLPEVMEIEQIAYPFPWTRGNFKDCLRSGYRCSILEYENEILGYSVISMAAGEAHILNICVHPGFRKRSVGRMLLAELMNNIEQSDVEVVLLEVRPSNQAAITLYESFGFNEIGRRRAYYPAINGREDALLFAFQIIKNLE